MEIRDVTYYGNTCAPRIFHLVEGGGDIIFMFDFKTYVIKIISMLHDSNKFLSSSFLFNFNNLFFKILALLLIGQFQ